MLSIQPELLSSRSIIILVLVLLHLLVHTQEPVSKSNDQSHSVSGLEERWMINGWIV